MEDVAVEQVCRIARQLVRYPGHAPHGKERIAEVRHRAQVQDLRRQKHGAHGGDPG
jgi:hypothetical protein